MQGKKLRLQINYKDFGKRLHYKIKWKDIQYLREETDDRYANKIKRTLMAMVYVEKSKEKNS